MSVSIRKSISFSPSFTTSEPTYTTVLTGRNYFVDIRILRSPPSSSLTRIDWSFAGTRESAPSSKPDTTRYTWTHLVSSKFPIDQQDSESADIIFPHPRYLNDETKKTWSLEQGSMKHPESGETVDYEEEWDDIDAISGTRVLFLSTGIDNEDVDEKGLIGIIGDLAVGAGRSREDGFWCFKALRKNEKWEVEFGEGSLEKFIGILRFGDGEENLKESDTKVVYGVEWVVKESWKVD